MADAERVKSAQRRGALWKVYTLHPVSPMVSQKPVPAQIGITELKSFQKKTDSVVCVMCCVYVVTEMDTWQKNRPTARWSRLDSISQLEARMNLSSTPSST